MVVLDLTLIQRIEATLHSLPNGLRGLVLASGSPRVFVAGADLKSIQAPGPGSAGLDDHGLDAYLAYGQRVFGMLSQLPFPTAAAINGAALGGGLELAMHCDGLIGAPDSGVAAGNKPFPIGLPEAGLSICPGWGGTNLLPARIDPADAIARTASGQTMMVGDAIKAGLFDQVAPDAASLLETARRWVVAQGGTSGSVLIPGGRRDGAPSRWIGRTSFKTRVQAAFATIRDTLPKTESARAVAAAVHAGLESPQGWQAALDVERRELVRLRSTPEGRAAIQGFFDKSRK